MENLINNGAPMIGYTTASVHPYNFKSKDIIIALTSLIIGFLFWEWHIISYLYFAPTLGVFTFLMIVIGITFYYMHEKGVSHGRTSHLLLALTIFSTFYFLIFDNTPLHFLMFIFVISTYVAWVVSLTGTSIMNKLNGFILGDVLNQVFIIPFLNFTAFFRSLLAKESHTKRVFLSTLIGTIISIPLICLVVILLVQADSGFQMIIDNFLSGISELEIIEFIWSFIIGIPVACYFFGFVYGNKRKRKTEMLKYDTLNDKFIKLHIIPRSGIYAPLVLLNGVYIIFLTALAGYLFSAFGGDLPESMTYAEYARRGFFELCAVATINLAVTAFSYTFLRRKESEYPKLLRILTGILSLFTILLVLTAMSKMLLYISSYGLTQLRIYTLWFMIVILFVFVLILIWHLRLFNLGKPLIIGCIALFLILGISNSDGLVAKYNIESYEKGYLETLDTEMFYTLSDAAYPYVSSYSKRADDLQMRKTMENIAHYYADDYIEIFSGEILHPGNTGGKWTKDIFRFNLQSLAADRR